MIHRQEIILSLVYWQMDPAAESAEKKSNEYNLQIETLDPQGGEELFS